MEEQGLFSPRVTKAVPEGRTPFLVLPTLSDLNVHLPASHVIGIF